MLSTNLDGQVSSSTVHCLWSYFWVRYPRSLSELGVDGTSNLFVINIGLLNLFKQEKQVLKKWRIERDVNIECFHMTSRRPYWCPKTIKRRPCWCPKPVLWELNSFLMQTISFVPINLHRCWPGEWKHSIFNTRKTIYGHYCLLLGRRS